ncbi:hypothetical protein PPL_04365 [Heterostelium album PN500]|uniref:Uncharacterized protein n=1 Tax=Heterostelium pallidum (strain ATCC 26659 / Pp 5 / PN500) TaxID=670386 RepID=D3B7C8_HETP5|nr:hypothetical protein PPL_04365 [Heterostelium album PN500]EFA82671.1 hypothetical protein PPL_04365 [Heterostelium album PN500]|eukprot:XP_020434788.1 hypothetical protein PPL_04365 [Heterostelium album PN500]
MNTTTKISSSGCGSYNYQYIRYYIKHQYQSSIFSNTSSTTTHALTPTTSTSTSTTTSPPLKSNYKYIYNNSNFNLLGRFNYSTSNTNRYSNNSNSNLYSNRLNNIRNVNDNNNNSEYNNNSSNYNYHHNHHQYSDDINYTRKNPLDLTTLDKNTNYNSEDYQVLKEYFKTKPNTAEVLHHCNTAALQRGESERHRRHPSRSAKQLRPNGLLAGLAETPVPLAHQIWNALLIGLVNACRFDMAAAVISGASHSEIKLQPSTIEFCLAKTLANLDIIDKHTLKTLKDLLVPSGLPNSTWTQSMLNCRLAALVDTGDVKTAALLLSQQTDHIRNALSNQLATHIYLRHKSSFSSLTESAPSLKELLQFARVDKLDSGMILKLAQANNPESAAIHTGATIIRQYIKELIGATDNEQLQQQISPIVLHELIKISVLDNDPQSLVRLFKALKPLREYPAETKRILYMANDIVNDPWVADILKSSTEYKLHPILPAKPTCTLSEQSIDYLKNKFLQQRINQDIIHEYNNHNNNNNHNNIEINEQIYKFLIQLKSRNIASNSKVFHSPQQELMIERMILYKQIGNSNNTNKRIVNSLFKVIGKSSSSTTHIIPYCFRNNNNISSVSQTSPSSSSSSSLISRSYSNNSSSSNNILFNRNASSLNFEEIDSPKSSSSPQQHLYTSHPIYIEIQHIKKLYEVNNYVLADQRPKHVGHLFAWIVKAKPFKVVQIIDDFMSYFLAIKDHMWITRTIEQYTWHNIPRINDQLLDKLANYIFTKMHSEPKILHLFNRSDISQYTLFTLFKNNLTESQQNNNNNNNNNSIINQLDLPSLPSLSTLIVYNEAMSLFDPKSNNNDNNNNSSSNNSNNSSQVKSDKDREIHYELFGHLRHFMWRSKNTTFLESIISIYLKLDCYHHALSWYARGANMVGHLAYKPFVAYHKLRGDEELARHWSAVSTAPIGDVAAMRSFLSYSIDPLIKGEAFRRQAAVRRGGFAAINADNQLAAFLEKSEIDQIIEKLEKFYFLNKELPRDQLIIRCAIAIYESVPEHYPNFLKLVPNRFAPLFSNPRFFSDSLQSDLMSGINMLPGREAVGNVGPFNDILISLVGSKRYTLLTRILAAGLEMKQKHFPQLQTRTLDAIANNLLVNIKEDQQAQQLASTVLTLLPQQHESLPLHNLKLSNVIQRGEYPLATELFQNMQQKDQLSYQLAAQILLKQHESNNQNNSSSSELSLEQFDSFFGIDRKTDSTPSNDLSQQQYATVFKIFHQANQTRLIREYFDSLMFENTLQTTNSLSQDLILLIMKVLEGQPALRCRFFKSLMDLKKMTSITPAIQILIKGDNEMVKDPHVRASSYKLFEQTTSQAIAVSSSDQQTH